MASKHTISRRVALGHVAGAATVVLGGSIPAALAQQKVSQANAKYQSHPNGQQRCDICQLFRPPSSCQIVAGTISPNGWCQFFTAKENAH
jgi:hypothetical protein